MRPNVMRFGRGRSWSAAADGCKRVSGCYKRLAHAAWDSGNERCRAFLIEDDHVLAPRHLDAELPQHCGDLAAMIAGVIDHMQELRQKPPISASRVLHDPHVALFICQTVWTDADREAATDGGSVSSRPATGVPSPVSGVRCTTSPELTEAVRHVSCELLRCQRSKGLEHRSRAQ